MDKRPRLLARIGKRAVAITRMGLVVLVAMLALDISRLNDSGTAGSAAAATTLTTVAPSTTTSTTALSTTTTTEPTLSVLQASLSAYISSRSDTASVAVYDEDTGSYVEAGDTNATFDTASVAKLTILIELLAKAQNENRSLTASELATAKSMISVSDNDSATALWTETGSDTGFTAMLARIGTTSTRTANSSEWGLTQTTAADQVKIMRVITESNSILNDASRAEAQSLLGLVTSAQHWGVSAGVPSSGTALLKNGWLPESSGWYINSVGYISADGHHYTIAVLTKDSATEAYGIATVEGISKLVANQLT